MMFGVNMACPPIPAPRTIMVAAMWIFLVPPAFLPVQAHAGTSEPLRAAALSRLADLTAAAYRSAHAEISVGSIDPRLNLPACADLKLDPAPGSRLWGAGNLVAECISPQPWKLYLSYKVTLTGPALLARRALAAGSTPAPGDLMPGTVIYAGDPGRYPVEAAGLAGATLMRPLPAGQPVTVDLLRTPVIIQAGQKVRAVLSGAGFQVGQEGIALGQAKAGDVVRLKTPSGRFIQGVVQPDGTVRIQF
jgi:flagella basal body P-ring formation protein FlgA